MGADRRYALSLFHCGVGMLLLWEASMTDAPNPFTATLPTQLRAWDSTSMRTYMECAQKYLRTIVQGWRRPGGIHVEWGRVFGASQEVFDKAIARGFDKEEALDLAFQFALEATGEYVPDMSVKKHADDCDFHLDQYPWECSCGERSQWRPWPNVDSKKNRYTLLRALVWYCDEQRLAEGDVRPYVFPDGRPAVELTFQIPLPLETPDGEPYLLTGHYDGLATTGGEEVFPRERKTTKNTLGPYYFDHYSPDIQIDNYDLAFNIMYPQFPGNAVMLEATQTGATFARFQRQFIHNTEAKRDEHLDMVLEWIRRAEHDADLYANPETRHRAYPMNKAACHNAGGCPFADICNKDPSVRERFLRANFVQQYWNPLEER